MNLQVLPLAVTMMMGPQIMSAIILVTTSRAVRASLAFLAGVAVATTFGVAVARGLFALLDGAVSLGAPSEPRSVGSLIQVGLVVLLISAAVKVFVRRESAEPPSWLSTLMEAGAGKAFIVGLLVILLMPSDIVAMLTVGANLVQNNASVVAALPFIAATVVIAASPLLALVVFHRRAQHVMPAVREWMNSHSWVVTIATCIIFVLLIIM